MKLTEREDVQEVVRRKYGEAAQMVLNGEGAACCGGNSGGGQSASCCGEADSDAITGGLYDATEAESLPEAALLASLGCGNPTALAELEEGETVLDLGSGGGIDVLLSARRVGPSGFAYGLDMTDEMLALAEKNKAEAGAQNVQFLKGQIEEIPLPDNSVDVLISNCVINLSADKDKVLSEAFRVLRPGGRVAVSDVVVEGELPTAVRADMEAYVGCVAGALEKDQYLAKLNNAGFESTSIEPTRRYTFADLEATSCASDTIAALSPEEKSALDGRIMSAFIRAVKPMREKSSDDTEKIMTIPLTVLPETPSVTVSVYDPAMCCSTGVCGADVDESLLQIAQDLRHAQESGMQVERFQLTHQPEAFVQNPRISGLLQAFGEEALPATLVNGDIVVHGRYPTSEELKAAVQKAGLPKADADGACCTGSGCC